MPVSWAGSVESPCMTRGRPMTPSAAQLGISQTAARSDAVMKKHNALARRLIDRQDDYLRFTQDWRIPADNNGSERDIRMIKLRQKVSGCLRTLTGAKQFCAIRSYLSTAAKHGKHFFNTLVMLAEGRPWLPAIRDLTSYCGYREVGSPGGISPPGSHRSRRDSLPSPGSYHLVHQKAGTHAQWAKSRGYWQVMRFQHAWAFLKGRSRLYFLRIQRIR
jgi:hypothetical protein